MKERFPVLYEVIFGVRISASDTSEKKARTLIKDKLVAIRNFAQIFKIRIREEVSAGEFADPKIPLCRVWHFSYVLVRTGETRTHTHMPHAIIMFCDLNGFEIVGQQTNLVVERPDAG
jgi:hypothetical protein